MPIVIFAGMKVRMFNFSHDLALARNCNRYTPPPNVQIMERDLASLADYFLDGEMSYNPHAPIWGWDRSAVNRLRAMGCGNLPSDSQLDTIRALSSRRTAVEMLPRIVNSGGALPLVGKSWYCSSKTDLLGALGQGKAVMKEPLSGSGRGLRFVNETISEAQLNWALRCVREQGGVVVEPYYCKIQDFAIEFLVTENSVVYEGLSLFATSRNNVYSGNWIASQSDLWQNLYKYFDASVYKEIKDILLRELESCFCGKYLGPLGVDMMIVEIENSCFLHPCVEINVRRTMGELSLHLASLVAPGRKGFFRLMYEKESEEICRKISEMPRPVYDENGKCQAGTLVLTPVLPTTHYVALLDVCD